MNRRTTWKRLCSGFLSMVLLGTLLPTSALAAGYADNTNARIVAIHKKMNNDNTAPTTDTLNPGPTGGKKLSPSYALSTDAFERTGSTINVWVTSSDMSNDEKTDYSTIPYVYDGDTYQSGTKWYLYQIGWANHQNPGNDTANGDVMTTDEIIAADSYDDYNFDLMEITADPQSATSGGVSYTRYSIRYYWTTTPPSRWENTGTEPAETYSVRYDINLPAEGMTLYTIVWDAESQQNALNIRDQGELGNITSSIDQMNAAGTTVTDGVTFGIASGLSNYEGFFLFKDNGEEPTDYYYFNGWTIGSDTTTTYNNGQSVAVSSQMADENNTINITANWVKIDPLTDKELVAADDALTLDVFERGGYYDGGSAALNNLVENDLLLQWTSTDKNLDGYGIKTGNDVMLDEESTISYLLTARLNSRLTNLRDNVSYNNFANFKFSLSIDNQLEFANVDADGNASIVFSSAFLKPVDDNPTNISGATVTDEGSGNYRITFDPDSIPLSTDQTSMLIEINVEWSLGQYSAQVSEPIQINGLDFKLKDTVADKANFTLNSSANITGSVDVKNRSTNIRFYYTAAYGLLNDSSAWQTHFGGNGADPVALVHALQFMDYKLANYDMSKEEDPDGPTNALTSGSSATKATYTAYTITASAGTGGSISPAGATSVYKGDDQPFTITPNEGFEIADITVDNEKVDNVAIQEDGTATYTFEDVTSNHTIAATFKSTNAVTFAPADIIVYMGGESYGGAVNEGGTIVSSSALPEPGFTIALPDGVTVEDLTDLTFTEQGGMGRTWALESYDGVSNEIYKLVPSNNAWPARMQFTTSDGRVIASDQFTVGLEVNTSFKMELYREGVGNISVKIGDVSYPVVSTSGTLTVRGTTEDVTIPSVTDTAPASGQPGAVAPAGTTYTINGGDVLVTDTSGVSLLFDEIIDTTSENRTSQLEDRAEESLPQLSSNRDYAYQFKYLDLVDANNGNAWVKASQDLTIYWPLPEGVDTSTLRVLHFEGLHRDMTSTNVEDAISGCTVTTVPHIVSGNYVTFQIGESGFSPFALVWETTTGGGGGGTTRYTITAEAGEGGSISPSGRVSVTRGSDKTFTISADDGYEIADVLVDGKSVGAVSRYTFENVRASHTIEVVFERTGPAVADPDDTGVSDWLNTEDHNAYLNGYPGSRFGPDNNMTRAEVAQMFYNLLLDKNVPITVTFDDVPADAWYTEAVNTLASLDILNGVGNNKFEPERSITRAEFTTIAMRFTNGTLSGTNIFPDVNPNDWFYDYVVGSIQYGWINGYPDGTFGPNDAITRAEVTTITNRMLGRSADEAFVDSHQDSLVQFGDITDRHWAYYQVMEATNGHDYTKTDGVEDWTRLN